MRSIVGRGLAAAAFTAAGLAALAPVAAAEPNIYEPVITPCSDHFRNPFEAPRPGTEVYWSPFGTSNIVCFDDGTSTERYYQRAPGGSWHDINELFPGHHFYSFPSSTVPDQATWG